MRHPVLGGPCNWLEWKEEEKPVSPKSHPSPPFIIGACDYSLSSIMKRTHMEWYGHIKVYDKGEIGKRVDNDRGIERERAKWQNEICGRSVLSAWDLVQFVKVVREGSALKVLTDNSNHIFRVFCLTSHDLALQQGRLCSAVCFSLRSLCVWMRAGAFYIVLNLQLVCSLTNGWVSCHRCKK